MKNDLRGRVITAVIFAAIMILGIYGHHFSLLILFMIVSSISLWEYLSIVLNQANDPTNASSLEKMGLCIVGSICYLLPSLVFLDVLPVHYLVLLLPILYLLFVKELYVPSKQPFTRLALQITGFLYICFPLALVNGIANEAAIFAPNKIMGILALVWSNDVFAYFTGRSIGKTPLFKRISPKKTWEGSIGGVVGTMVLAGILSLFFKDFTPVEWLGIAFLVAIFGGIGDLIESLLKRSFKIKDSGKLLPHHGGFLDRFDAFIFLLPFVYTFLCLCKLTD